MLFFRYNNYKNDPFSKCDCDPPYSGENTISARSDLNPVDGKTRAQQVARLKEWKKHFLKLGADKVVVKESGPGNIDAAWIFEIHHKNSAAYGVAIDDYYKSPKSHDDIMAKWQKTPTLKFSGYSLFFEVDEI